MHIELSKAIYSFVEAMLPRFSPDDLVLHVTCEATFFNQKAYDNTDDGEDTPQCRVEMNFMFHRTSNYTKVFFLTQNRSDRCHFSTFLCSEPAKWFADKWELIGNHDSCWRDSVDRKIRELRESAMEKLGIDYPLHPADSYVSFGLSGPELCHAQVEALERSPRGYDKYSIIVTDRVDRSSGAALIASTCPVDELPLLINYSNSRAPEGQNQRVRDIAVKRLKANEQ